MKDGRAVTSAESFLANSPVNGVVEAEEEHLRKAMIGVQRRPMTETIPRAYPCCFLNKAMDEGTGFFTLTDTSADGNTGVDGGIDVCIGIKQPALIHTISILVGFFPFDLLFDRFVLFFFRFFFVFYVELESLLKFREAKVKAELNIILRQGAFFYRVVSPDPHAASPELIVRSFGGEEGVKIVGNVVHALSEELFCAIQDGNPGLLTLFSRRSEGHKRGQKKKYDKYQAHKQILA